jgi:hypothetical protein
MPTESPAVTLFSESQSGWTGNPAGIAAARQRHGERKEKAKMAASCAGNLNPMTQLYMPKSMLNVPLEERILYASMDPTGSFLRFLVGFVTFIGVSFGVTFVVNSYTATQTVQQQTASAEAAMLK